MTTFFKYIKLNNGESLIAKTAESCENALQKTHIEILDPVLIVSVKIPKGNFIFETFVMQPWLKPAKQGIIFLPVASIVVMAELEESVVDQYLGFIRELKYSFREQSDTTNIEHNETTLELEEDDDEDSDISTVAELDDFINNIMDEFKHAGKKTFH